MSTLEAARPLVVWGGVLPFEALFPPLARRETIPSLVIFGIGVTSLAPYGVAHWGGNIDGLIRRFTSEQGLSLVARANGIAMLEIYCRERFRGTLRKRVVQQSDWRRHSEVSCLPPSTPPLSWTGPDPGAISAERMGPR